MRLMHGLNGWVFVLGQTLDRASLVSLHGHGFFFESRVGAVNAARKCGLRVARNGNVSVAPGQEPTL